MKDKLSYAQILRTVGQMLEGLEIHSFTLTIQEDGVAISTRQSQRGKQKRLRVIWQTLRGKQTELAGAHKPYSGLLEFHYTATDIERMDSDAHAKRAPADGAPEPHALSQILRAVGGIVDQKAGTLLALRKDNQNVEFDYRSQLNKTVTQQFTVPGLYDYWVKMYLRRNKPAL